MSRALLLLFIGISALPLGCGGSGSGDGDADRDPDTIVDGDHDPDPDPEETPCTLTHCPVGPVCVSPTYLVTVTEEHDVCLGQQCRGERRYCLDGCVDQPVPHCEGDVLDGDREEAETEPEEEFVLDGDKDFEMPDLMPCETLVSYEWTKNYEIPVRIYGENAVYIRFHDPGPGSWPGLHVFNTRTKQDRLLPVGGEPHNGINTATIWGSIIIFGLHDYQDSRIFKFKTINIDTGKISTLPHCCPVNS